MKKIFSPFHRFEWDIFSLVFWDRSAIFGLAGKRIDSFLARCWPFQQEWKEWASNNVLPLFSLFWPSRVVSPTRGESYVGSDSFPWSVDTPVADTSSSYCRAAAYMSGLFTHVWTACTSRILHFSDYSEDDLLSTFPIGRLGFKDEGSGKLRVFAIPNALKQALLRPAHEWCIESFARSIKALVDIFS